MAEQRDSMGGGGEDLYGSDADAKPDMRKEDEAAEPADEGDEHSDSEEAILPKSILAGKEFNVGDEVILKITAMHDDRISVKYAPAKPEGKDEGGDQMEEADMPPSMGGGGGDSNYD